MDAIDDNHRACLGCGRPIPLRKGSLFCTTGCLRHYRDKCLKQGVDPVFVRTCPCGKVFETNNPSKAFCSELCAERHRNQKRNPAFRDPWDEGLLQHDPLFEPCWA